MKAQTDQFLVSGNAQDRIKLPGVLWAGLKSIGLTPGAVLRHSRPDLLMVAGELGVSDRTLQRRITDEGTTFRQLLNDTRTEERFGQDATARPDGQPAQAVHGPGEAFGFGALDGTQLGRQLLFIPLAFTSIHPGDETQYRRCDMAIFTLRLEEPRRACAQQPTQSTPECARA